MSDPLAELVVEKYAEARGEDPRKVKERLLPVLTARRPSRLDRMAGALASVADLLGKVREAGKDMPDQVRTPLATLAAAAVGAALGAEDEDPVEEGVRGAAKYIAQIKAIDSAFGGGGNAALKLLADELGKLRERMERMEEEGRSKALEELAKRLEGLEGALEELREGKEDERRRELLEQVAEQVAGLLKPLDERLKAIEEARGAQPPQPPPSVEDLVAQVDRVKGEAERLLKGMGYEVRPAYVTREEVQRMIEEAEARAREEALSKLSAEELRKRLEAMGYRVEGGPITWDQVQKMMEEARRRAYEEALEDRRIEAVERTVSNAFSQIAQIFAPAVSALFGVPPAAQAATAAGGQGAEGGGEASRQQAGSSQAQGGTA